MATKRRRKAGERGAAAVEMALVFPVLFLMVFGIIDLSRVLNGMIEVSQGAREGVRLAALAPSYSSTDITSRAQAAAPNPAFGGSASVSIDKTCPNAVDGIAQVTVSFTFKGIIFYTGTPKTFSQTAQMRCGG